MKSKKEKYEDNPDSIKYYVKKYILENQKLFKGKRILDLPAGSGVTTRILTEIGAKPMAYDLFPEFFQESGVRCKSCDINRGIPEKDSSFDVIICQEGIEHFTDPYQAFNEMSRVLKTGGLLLITTPNYSSLQSRFSYLFFESENYRRYMPPNEYESLWFIDRKLKNQGYYFGHVFLKGIQQLRLLWKITGFELHEAVKNRRKSRNLLLMVWYPVLWAVSYRLLLKNLRKVKKEKTPFKRQAFMEQFKLNISPRILLHSHLFVILKKVNSMSKTYEDLNRKNKSFQSET